MGLLELPIDIHEIIVDQLLFDIPEPLFAPIYKKEGDNIGDYGELENKCSENYSKRDEDQLESAQAFLNWSSTCHHFRKLLAPKLFKCVILRSRPKSVASIMTLMQSANWKRIESFIFVSTEHEYNEDGSVVLGEYCHPDDNQGIATHRDASGNYSLEAEMSELHSIIRNLPPNLKSLTLDFPNGWGTEWCQDIMEGGIFNEGEDDQYPRYRAQLRTTIEAASLNDISSKPEFEFRLLSVPIIHCSAYETKPFHEFLNKVSSFTLAVCHWDNGAGWNLNVIGDHGNDAAVLALSLSEFFLNHLKSVKSLCVYGDDSWPLGDGLVLMHTVDVMLPDSADRMPALKHICFKQFFICDQLQSFLLRQIDNLESIDLTDCFASGENPGDEPNWTSFFSSIARAQPKKLRQLNIKNASRTLEDLFGGRHDEAWHRNEDHHAVVDRKKALNLLKEQDAEAKTTLLSDMNGKPVGGRQKQLLAHVSVDDKYGMIFDSEEVNVSVFLEGSAHNEWLKIVDIMENNSQCV